MYSYEHEKSIDNFVEFNGENQVKPINEWTKYMVKTMAKIFDISLRKKKLCETRWTEEKTNKNLNEDKE